LLFDDCFPAAPLQHTVMQLLRCQDSSSFRMTSVFSLNSKHHQHFSQNSLLTEMSVTCLTLQTRGLRGIDPSGGGSPSALHLTWQLVFRASWENQKQPILLGH